jgi:DegV family protein with EDD domain
MARVAIVTDSTADLPAEIRTARQITVVPLNVQFGEETYRDQVDITTDEFLERMTASQELPKTSQPAPGLFQEVFRTLATEFEAIVAVLLSSKLSGAVQSATLAAADVEDEIHVEVVDSFNVSLGLGFQVLRAAELAESGLDAREIAQRLRDEIDAYHLVFFVDTLDHLKRGGRIGTAATLVGTILQLKPVLRIDEGQVVPFERTRTRAKAVEALKDFAASWPAINRLGVLYSTDRSEAERFVDQLELPLAANRITISQIGPVLSSHVGPGVMGVCIDDTEVV